MLGLSVIPAVLQFLGFLVLPESPRWLLQQGHAQQAQQVLIRIRGTAHVNEEYDTIKTSIEDEGDSGGGEYSFLKIKKKKVKIIYCLPNSLLGTRPSCRLGSVIQKVGQVSRIYILF